MRELRVVGLSEDGSHLVLVGAADEKFRVPVAAVEPAPASPPTPRQPLEKKTMDSALRPKDIQARIRGGESPESVAAAADVPVERIMGYAVPVLAEREHMCERARRSAVRRKHTSGPGRLLGDAIDEHLRSRNIDPGSTEWDSWRREDGRWTVTVESRDADQTATYLFDLPGRYVMATDDEARRLIDDVPPVPDPSDLAIAAAVAEAELMRPQPVEEPTPEPTPEPEVEPSQGGAEVTPLRRRRGLRRKVEHQLTLDQAELTADAPAEDDLDAVVRATAHESDNDQEPPRRRPGRRASVPSWDEIMFGGGRSD